MMKWADEGGGRGASFVRREKSEASEEGYLIIHIVMKKYIMGRYILKRLVVNIAPDTNRVHKM